jgi:hypothetical protein
MQLHALADRKRPPDRDVDGEGQPRIGRSGDAGARKATLEDESAHGAGAKADMAVGRARCFRGGLQRRRRLIPSDPPERERCSR